MKKIKPTKKTIVWRDWRAMLFYLAIALLFSLSILKREGYTTLVILNVVTLFSIWVVLFIATLKSHNKR